MAKVIVADSEHLVRGAIMALLRFEPDLEVVADTDRSDQVVELARRHRAAVAVIDYNLPGQTGADVARELAAKYPSCRSLILASRGCPAHLTRSMQAGASGFLVKSTPAEYLADAIRRIEAGERVVDPALAVDALLGPRNPLTTRETEILKLVATGINVTVIARELYLTAGTVRNHISSVMTKLGARNRLDAVRIGTQQGWL
ncbi:MAG TPA: response regulator transcription factor [Streptosporangiaceae bacterium]|nr:response regulator transcription factor [Streptosporangiaceae bacterium]